MAKPHGLFRVHIVDFKNSSVFLAWNLVDIKIVRNLSTEKETDRFYEILKLSIGGGFERFSNFVEEDETGLKRRNVGILWGDGQNDKFIREEKR